MDIAHAQKAFGLQGSIDRVDLILSEEVGFRERWKDGFVIQSSQQKSEAFSSMLGAFRLNLEALSLLALFVGVFLIYNTAMFAVVSRRRDTGILRSLGARRYELMVAFLTEILILGVTGGALGGVLGYFLTRFLTELIGSSISNLYFFLRPAPTEWSAWILLTGIILGCGASLLGGAIPLVEMVRSDPIKTLSGRVASRGRSSKGQKDRPGRFHPPGSQFDSFPPAGRPHLCGLCWGFWVSGRYQPSDRDRPSLSLSGFEMGTLWHWKATWKGCGRKHPTEPGPDLPWRLLLSWSPCPCRSVLEP